MSDEKISQELRDQYKVPFSCYACGCLMYNWDNSAFYKYGVCSDCSINYIEDRELPENLFRDRVALLEYVKTKISEKTKKDLNNK